MFRNWALILLGILVILYFWSQPVNTIPVTIEKNGVSTSTTENNVPDVYMIHRAHPNKDKAAALLRESVVRIQKLLNHLDSKYNPHLSVTFNDPARSGQLDIINSSMMYTSEFGNNTDTKEYVQERIVQLITNYNPKDIKEISPTNWQGFTAYTVDKRHLVICLRSKEKNAQGVNDYPLHDINTIMFVTLHEITHMANNAFDHKKDFWSLFKFLLLNAVEIDIYKPVNYSKNPIEYCGMKITYNPLFDDTL